jgi:hypothetical protein
MYVAGRLSTDPLGQMSPGTDVAPGIAFGQFFGRAGDYGGIQVDPSDGTTFWAFNEYLGTNPVYNTFIASFTVTSKQDEDWYSFATNAGDKLKVKLTLPGSSSGFQFVNNLAPMVQLYDPNGNLVAAGSTAFNYTVPAGQGGTYAIRVFGASKTEGEYVLQVSGATGAPAAIAQPVSLAGASGTTAGSTGGSHFASTVLGDSALQASLTLLSASSKAGSTTSASPLANVSTTGTSFAGVSAAAIQNNGAIADSLFALLSNNPSASAADQLFAVLAHQLAPVLGGTQNVSDWVAEEKASA